MIPHLFGNRVSERANSTTANVKRVTTLTLPTVAYGARSSRKWLHDAAEASTFPDVVECQDKDIDRETSIPRRVEMLNVFARYEAHITNEIIKTVRLIHFLPER